MPLQINSPGWRIQGGRTARGARARAAVDLPGLPAEFLTDESSVAEEVVLEPAQPTRAREAVDSSGLDMTYDLEPGQTAVLAIRLPSGALTFHLPVQSTSRSLRGPSQVRFQVAVRRTATRGIGGQAIKAVVIKVGQVAADKAVSFVLPRLAEAFEKATWKRRGLKEGWLRVTQETLAAGVLEAAKPVSTERSLLFIHGTFSNAAAAYGELAQSKMFDRLKDTYGDRMFAFDHFTVSRTPEQNALMLLEGLPAHATTFDVVTHSRGGLVLRSLVERASQLGDLSRRFKVGRAVLVASPNEGTPLATPKRWDETLGLMANLLEMFPDNPLTTGAAFVANGLVWLANHASGDLPGLHAMDGDGDVIAAMQGPPGPPAGAYSALVANFHPTGATLQRLFDVGIDQFFATANDLVVPSEGGWRVDRSTTGFVPASRIGCFGPGGNLPRDMVTHLNFFSQPETVDFVVNALLDRPQPLNGVDPRKALPDHRLLRGAMTDGPGIAAKGRAPVSKPDAAARQPKAGDEAPLRITVTNGDLTFEPEALLLGHYRATRLTGTEAVMNRLIGGAMAHSLQVGVYPLAVGTNQIFINTRPDFERGAFMPRPKAVIVVGLGEEGKLRPADLAHSVRQAVIAWAQRLAEQKRRGTPAFFEVAATLIGSGGTGVSAGEAARLIAQGVYDANGLLKATHSEDAEWPRVRHLHLIELYLDRATDAWRALRLQEAATPGRYEVGGVVQTGIGALQRPPDSGYRGTGYDFITVEVKEEKESGPVISYTLDTRRARSEVRGQRTQSALLRDLVATASNDQNRDQQVGRTLFNLLIPLELEAYMASSGEMQIELVPGTAGIPWELLDTTSDIDLDQHPWAIRVKLLRKLRVERIREQVIDADADACVLVIGEPECPQEFPRLPGARAEAIAVQNRLTQPGALDPGLVTGLLATDASEPGANARTVVNALFERPWRIVHIAGHGMVASGGRPGGVVLSNGTFLGPDEISNMRAVPELVFVNCCHLAGGDAGQLLRYDRAEFASGVAEALIRIGVRCVIAAGWAVDDDSASLFADTFYGSLLRGNRFIDAVGEARATTYEQTPNVNTWAAYQCYGDPDWVFRRGAPDPNQHTTPSADDFSGVASMTSLKLAIERIVVQTKFQGADLATQLLNLQKLEKLFGDTWGKSGAVAELFGEAFVEAGAFESGMHWYERAVAAPDGRASVRAAEQLANVRCRLGWEIVDQARRHHDDLVRQEKASGQGKSRVAARRAQEAAKRSLDKSVERADELTDEALALLMKLRALGETLERESLIGSVFKRKALINAAGGRRDRVRSDLQDMKAHYRHARVVGAKNGASDLYYPASNCLAADVALNAGLRRWRTLDPDDRTIVVQSLKAKNRDAADFWSVAGDIELRVYEALARRRLASERKQVDKAYLDLHDRVKATRMWASVYDTAYLVLQNYAERANGKEKTAALALLGQLRLFAHPEAEQ